MAEGPDGNLSKVVPLSRAAVVVLGEGFLDADINDEVVALSIERGTCYGMNRVAARVWHLIKTPARVSDVCATLCQEFKVSPKVCERDVISLLEELRAEGMIRTLEG